MHLLTYTVCTQKQIENSKVEYGKMNSMTGCVRFFVIHDKTITSSFVIFTENTF